MKPNRVLVLGGTGFVGRRVCAKAQAAGWTVTVPTRQTGAVPALQALPSVTVVNADVHDRATLQRLLPGHDAVVNLVAILHGSEAAFERTHVQLPQTLAAACTAAGVRRVVHVSALGVAPDAPSRYQRSKARGEAVWRSSGLDVTLLRPSVIFGADDRFLNLFAQLQRLAPVMPLASAHARFQPVWVDDVAEAVVRSLQAPQVQPVVQCAGPEVLSLADLVRLAGRHGSRQRPVLPLPDWLGRLQATAMELMPGEPLMSRDNLDAMQIPNIADPALPGLDSLGIDAANVHTVAPQYLAARRSH
jgi:uncharacterized protein YbjT (DUF2867 family)